MNFEDLVKAKVDLPVFRLPEGTVNQNLRQTFERLMIDTGLLISPNTGQNRTLYSLRRTYEPPPVFRRLQSKYGWSLWKKVTEQTGFRPRFAHARFG